MNKIYVLFFLFIFTNLSYSWETNIKLDCINENLKLASRNIPKFIGGIHHSRHHIGQKSDVLPMTVVNPDEQRKALNFLLNNILSSAAFSFEPEFLNKMAPERYGDLSGSMWRMSRIDFPIHNIVKALQKTSTRHS